MPNRTTSRSMLGLVFMLSLTTPPAHAALIEFTFNTLADGASNATVDTYMQQIVTATHPGGTIEVTGSRGEVNYTGDDHVVGPTVPSLYSETLGTSDQNVHHGLPLDTFLVNNESTTITMQFSFPIYYASFDYQIFPDSTCETATCPGASWPDFTFEANDSEQFHQLGIVPGTLGTFAHSPFSGPISNELAPQFLGISGGYLFAGGVTKLEFIDWPRMIGIDNLLLEDNPCSVRECPPPPPVIPEPGSLFLVGSGLIGMAVRRRSRKSPR